MRYSPTLFAVALFLFLFPCAVHVTRGADKPALEGTGKVTPDGKGIERLVKQLGSDEFKEREAASSALRKVGKAALNALLKAAKGSDDLEVRTRAARLILAIRDDLARPIDLEPHVNQKLNERFHDYHPGNDLASLPKGRQTFAGVKFTVGVGVVQLGAGKPNKVEGIKVGVKAEKLHFLHAGGHQNGAPLNTPIGKYVVHYADKTKAEVEVAYGRDVVDWWVQPGVADPTRGKVAWEGENKLSRVKLFLTTWENPKPDKLIVALDYVTTKYNPFCVAITAEE
jgi:hypothetical protein